MSPRVALGVLCRPINQPRLHGIAWCTNNLIWSPIVSTALAGARLDGGASLELLEFLLELLDLVCPLLGLLLMLGIPSLVHDES